MAGNDIVEALYEAVTRDDAFRAVLQLLSQRFRCQAAALAYIDPSIPESNLLFGSGILTPAEMEIYNREYAAYDPAPATFAKMNIGEVALTSRVFGNNNPDHAFFINGYYRRLGFEDSMGGPIAREEGRFGLVAVLRTREREPFTDADAAELSKLIPLIAKVISFRRAFFKHGAMAHNLRASIDDFPAAVMIFDRNGVLDHANRFARTVLSRNDGLALDREGKLRAIDRRVEAALQDVTSGRATEGTIIRLERRNSEMPYVVRIVAPRQSGMSDGASVFVSDPARAISAALPPLAEALGVTDSVWRLMAALASGSDLKAYAREAGISYNTAKFHLRSAFAATGTQRQSDLVRVVVAIIRDLALIR